MNTNYDDEATRYQGADNEDTVFEQTSAAENTGYNPASEDEANNKTAKGMDWRRAAAGAASGLLIGGISTTLMGMKSAGPAPVKDRPAAVHEEESSQPEWVDDEVRIATAVDDGMSFGEAFAAARAEVGPGGCFEWHGNVYGTYTADEWNDMTPEQRAEWGDHFNWNHIDRSQSDVAQSSATADDDIEIVSVDHDHNPDNADGQEVLGSDSGPEIEILGVVHDSETDANIGGLTVDGQEVVLIDVDGDMEFDYMISDANGNGEVDSDELVDIQGHGLTVDGLGGFTDTAGDMQASNDAPDYTSDIYEV